MDTTTIRLANDLFQRAADLPLDQRPAFLDQECNGHTHLRTFVNQLLAEFDAPAKGLLDSPLLTGSSPSSGQAVPIPKRLGAYEITKVLGEGGMAVVYEARQQNPSRTVALKVLRPGVLSPELIRRFQHEIEVLGQLQHPGIAHIYEADVAQTSLSESVKLPQPYYAMELIRGVSLTAYCLRHNLSDKEKLELLAKVCDAVQYAHQKGVIHRDLKPANILVELPSNEETTERGDATSTRSSPSSLRPSVSSSLNVSTPQPKVLDFGVARVADPNSATMNTEAGRLIGTLAYMSPEQVGGQVNETDTRSDVYALGVILYELLTTELPFSVTQCPLPEAVRRIREESPTRLGIHDSRFKGDIETIVARAMARDKARRYQSASDLAADIRRHLRGEAIEARRDSAMYVLRKTASRHRALVAAALILFLGITGFAAFAYTQARRFQALSVKEHDARVSAETVKDFLGNLLALANPGPGKGYDLTLTDMLDDATQRLERGELAHSPHVEAEVRDQLSVTYDNLELMDGAVLHRKWLVNYHRSQHGGHSEALLYSLIALGRSYSEADNQTDSMTTLQEALTLSKRILGDDAPKTYEIMTRIAITLARQRKPEEALTYAQAAAEGLTRVRGLNHFDTGFAYWNLAGIYNRLGRQDDVKAAFLTAIPILDATAPASITTIRCRWSYGSGPLATQSLTEAETYLRETISLATTKLGDDHPETLSAKRALAGILVKAHREEEARAILTESLHAARNVRRWVLGNEGSIAADLVACLRKLKEYDEALAELTITRERLEKFRGRTHSRVISLLGLAADVAQDKGDNILAAATLEDAVQRMKSSDPDETDTRVPTWTTRAEKLRHSAQPQSPSKELEPQSTQRPQSEK